MIAWLLYCIKLIRVILYRYHIVRNFTFVLILCNVSTLWLQLLSLNTLLLAIGLTITSLTVRRGDGDRRFVA